MLPLAALLWSGPAAAEELPLPAGPIEPAAEALAPGDFLWADRVSPEGPVTILVSLPVQRAYVYRNGVLIGISTVSTGREGHETPTGVFTILQKRREHYSNLYDNAPMPFMQRLTWDGIALHAGTLPGHPASHGCIRLPEEFARKLFAVTDLGITVVVTASPDIPRVAARTPEAAGSDDALPAGGKVAGEVRWRPWLQKEGPISILVSAADRQIRVIRNGVEIGRAPVGIGRPVTHTEIYQLFWSDAAWDEFIWASVPLEEGEHSEEVSPSERAKLMLPKEFRAQLAEELTGGAVVVVTPDSLDSASFDKTLAIVEPGS
ncbi:L,D-transpeptidase [Pacificimonas aurantium]|uniref:L,D-transpeptidase n=1 Tax=Pacificimonas aurantium TaxID=1250540 RepID=A0ABS7WHW2_9SPHN|nr:L,D-transpeptidase [Pacificimonas aurantium]